MPRASKLSNRDRAAAELLDFAEALAIEMFHALETHQQQGARIEALAMFQDWHDRFKAGKYPEIIAELNHQKAGVRA